MPEPSPRPLKTIDADLRSCWAQSLNASMELAEVRRRQAELVEMEAALLAAIDMRTWRADRLLDERLRAVAGADLPEQDGGEQYDVQVTGSDGSAGGRLIYR